MTVQHDYSQYISNKSAWYYLTFPIDAWSESVGPEYQIFGQQKEFEIYPIMRFLIPGIIFFSGMSLNLGLFSNLFFFAFESFLLAVVCKFYVQLENFGFVIELTFNFLISFILNAIGLMMLFVVLGIFF